MTAGILGFLYYRKQVNLNLSNSKRGGQTEVRKEKTPEEKKQDLINLMVEMEKANPTATQDPKQLEKNKETLVKLMSQMKKSNPQPKSSEESAVDLLKKME